MTKVRLIYVNVDKIFSMSVIFMDELLKTNLI
jgi:hypothetical protein